MFEDSIPQRGMCSLMQTGTLWNLCDSDHMIVGFTPSGSIGWDSNVQIIALVAKALSTISDALIEIT